jgi:SAM-dependent methyltransferase
VSTPHSDLLESHLKTITEAALKGPILDLACGKGRNGLYLIENKIPTVFADRNPEVLDEIKQQLQDPLFATVKNLASLWSVDFEAEPQEQLKESSFAGILVYRYLHRPLLDSLKRAILTGGLVIYETFTVDQPQFGRPKNPDFLLQPGELTRYFSDWKVLHKFEGKIENYAAGKPAAIAQIVAQKPL